MNHQAQPIGPADVPAPRLHKGIQGAFIEADWPGSNISGLRPFGDYVLVKMDAAAPTSPGGVILTDEEVERITLGAESGCIFAIGSLAFKAHGPDHPGIGERVYVEKYAGIKAMGQDGALYRIMEDKCVAAGYDRQGGE